MLTMLLLCIGMMLITVLIQYFAFRAQKFMNFWTGTSVIFAISILGVISNDPAYFAAILGFIAGDAIGLKAGWHKS